MGRESRKHWSKLTDIVSVSELVKCVIKRLGRLLKRLLDVFEVLLGHAYLTVFYSVFAAPSLRCGWPCLCARCLSD